MKKNLFPILFFVTISTFGQTQSSLEEFPYFLVCKLKMKIGTNVYNGSGFIVADSFLITNAHNVYDKDSLIIIPGYSDGISPYGEILICCKKGENVFIPEEFDNDEISESFDFAIVKLPTCETLKKLTTKANYSSITIGNLEKEDKLVIAGYPVYHWFEFKKDNGEIQFTNATSDFALHKDKSLVDYRMNTRGGNSGSPLWVYRNNRIVLVGIHKSGKGRYNQGILYDDYKKQFIENFIR